MTQQSCWLLDNFAEHGRYNPEQMLGYTCRQYLIDNLTLQKLLQETRSVKEGLMKGNSAPENC